MGRRTVFEVSSLFDPNLEMGTEMDRFREGRAARSTICPVHRRGCDGPDRSGLILGVGFGLWNLIATRLDPLAEDDRSHSWRSRPDVRHLGVRGLQGFPPNRSAREALKAEPWSPSSGSPSTRSR